MPRASSSQAGKAPLAGWVVVERSQGAIRCDAFGAVVYVARDKTQAAALRRTGDRLVFTRQELSGDILRGMSEEQMETWLTVVLPVKRVFSEARVEKVKATR